MEALLTTEATIFAWVVFALGMMYCYFLED